MNMAQQQMIKRGRGRPPKTDMYGGSGKDMYGQDMSQMRPQTKDFQCTQCGKTYLSNPALYLHMKIKHI